jgi:hypothetical protein
LGALQSTELHNRLVKKAGLTRHQFEAKGANSAEARQYQFLHQNNETIPREHIPVSTGTTSVMKRNNRGCGTHQLLSTSMEVTVIIWKKRLLTPKLRIELFCEDS